MRHEQFLIHREALLRERPGLLDLSQANLYRELAQSEPSRFGPLLASDHPEAPYRCHIAERFLAALGWAPELKARALVSHGVRRSLSALFALCAGEGWTLGVPSDVYPAYGALAESAGAKTLGWMARGGAPDEALLRDARALLICEPLKPWGEALGEAGRERLSAWAREPGRLLIIDSAYAFGPTPWARELALEGSAALLLSLSKGWLLPDHAGLALLPEALLPLARPRFAALPKDEGKLRIAYGALSSGIARPQQVAAALSERSMRFELLKSARPDLALGPLFGYFAQSALSPEELLDRGALGIPPSVFGSDARGSVVSSLGLRGV